MCGFAGIYMTGNRSVAESDLDLVKAARQSLAHRGPDSTGFYNDDNFAVGFNRLSIVGIQDGFQPFHSADKRYVTVFNGEIYNYKELSAEYLDKEARSEVEGITELYALLGDRMFGLLRGMFAIVVYDTVLKEFVAARDMFGIKPFYYGCADGAYVFASELQGLPMGHGSKTINRDAVNRYCEFGYVPEPQTIYNEVRALPGGRIARFGKGGVTITEFAVKKFVSRRSVGRGGEKNRLRQALEECVARYMEADVEVGTFLSGGVDSSIITALASKINPALKAFSIGFDNKYYPSEAELARKTAEYLGIDLICRTFDSADFVNAFEPTVRHLGSPMADPSIVGLYLVSKTASDYVKVALSGEGADELFGGYRIYRTTAWTGRLGTAQSAADFSLRLLSRFLAKDSVLRGIIKDRCFRLDKHFIGPTFIMGGKERKQFLSSEMYSPSDHRGIIRRYIRGRGMSRLQRMQMCDWNLWLPCDILYKGDRLSMANSLEVRVPFLDRMVYDVAKELKDSEKVSLSQSKILLRETFADLLPPDVVSRPKLGFPVPVASWLKNDLYDWGRSYLGSEAAAEIIDGHAALDLFERYRRGAVPEFSFRTIWLLIVLSAWYDNVRTKL